MRTVTWCSPREADLSLQISYDGGVSRDAATAVDRDCWFNGYLIDVESDVVLVFYYHPSLDGAAPDRPRMQRRRVTPEGPMQAL